MTTLLALNYRSGSQQSDRDAYEAKLAGLGPVVVHDVCDETPTADVVRSIGAELERIVVGGGDGTVNGMLSTVRDAGVPMGVLPLGTANDFARSLDIPDDPLAALDVVVAGATRRIGLGEANGKLFVNAAGLGLGPDLTKTLDEERKTRLGVFAYFASLVEVLGDRRTRRATLEIGDRTRRTKFLQITIANGKHYGGGLTISRDARLDDGKLRVLCIRPQSIPELLGRILTLRWGVTGPTDRQKLWLETAEEVRIRTQRPCDVTLDGEFALSTPITCRCIPSAIDVYAPFQRVLAEG